MKFIFLGVWCAILSCALARQATAAEPVDENLPPPIPALAIPKQKLTRAALFDALARGKIQAVIYDEPFLRHVVRNEYATKFTVLPLHLDPQLYAFALRQGSPLRKSINRELLHEISEPDWADVLYRFMGYAPN
jgi:ABC-type amino acid transport substrate-binding protein